MESLIENMSACNLQQDSSDEANDPGSKKLKYEISDIISNFKAKTQVDRMISIKIVIKSAPVISEVLS